MNGKGWHEGWPEEVGKLKVRSKWVVAYVTDGLVAQSMLGRWIPALSCLHKGDADRGQTTSSYNHQQRGV